MSLVTHSIEIHGGARMQTARAALRTIANKTRAGYYVGLQTEQALEVEEVIKLLEVEE